MKTFEELFRELTERARSGESGSHTVQELRTGKHGIGKKIIEEACEVWMAAEYEGRERTAEEMAQLIYHLQVLLLACDMRLEDVYRYL